MSEVTVRENSLRGWNSLGGFLPGGILHGRNSPQVFFAEKNSIREALTSRANFRRRGRG